MAVPTDDEVDLALQAEESVQFELESAMLAEAQAAAEAAAAAASEAAASATLPAAQPMVQPMNLSAAAAERASAPAAMHLATCTVGTSGRSLVAEESLVAAGTKTAVASAQQNGHLAAPSEAKQTPQTLDGLPGEAEPKNIKTNTTEPSQGLPVTDAPTPQRDREWFSGLRITKRTIPEKQWVEEIRGKNRRVLPLPRLTEELNRRQFHDRVVIAVLYDKANQEKLANGENYACWKLTNLASPEPMTLALHLRWQAYAHWRGKQAGATATRGSIFAIMNPAVVYEARGLHESKEATARVEKAAQLFKLGECPTLGKCKSLNCQLPCNADAGDRFCFMHLKLAYSNKPGRIIGGGVADRVVKSLHSSRQKAGRRLTLEQLQPLLGEDEDEDAELHQKEAKRVKLTEIALQMDERRLNHSDANHDYIRSVMNGTRADGEATSRVPVMGRGLNASKDMELDLATVPTDEKRKAERMLEQRAADKMHQRSSKPQPQQRTAPRRQQALQKPALGDLVQALTIRRSAQRGNMVLKASAAQETNDERASAIVTADAPSVGSSGSGVATEEPGSVPTPTRPPDALPPLQASNTEQHAATIQRLLQELSAASGNFDATKQVLDESDKLPVEARKGAGGQQLYRAIGLLTLENERHDIKRLAACARRQWRAAFHNAAMDQQQQQQQKQQQQQQHHHHHQNQNQKQEEQLQQQLQQQLQHQPHQEPGVAQETGADAEAMPNLGTVEGPPQA
eukprot:CAMPEP_0172674760 /NCGR_PEP_ID=MMETSP1074-20121228/12905_1 /TAXON_ID=2916 /ORGANISM="Ceratium fusus, Strain PA161109" /LENGTH=739 /DNA_ID=CAMNT_0013492191 /DNA_START=140 /DNA_END=2359 /DNA_ORIENTATION=+